MMRNQKALMHGTISAALPKYSRVPPFSKDSLSKGLQFIAISWSVIQIQLQYNINKHLNAVQGESQLEY